MVVFKYKIKLKNILFFVVMVIHFSATGQKNDFPYKFNKSDYYILPAAVAFELSSKLIYNDEAISKQTIAGLNRTAINGFDIGATYNWDIGIDKTSDILTAAALAAPLMLAIPLIHNNNNRGLLVYSVMYSEAIMLTVATASLTKSLSNRYRPYLYNTNLSVDDRHELAYDGDYNNSFFSRHTALAFCSATFLSKTFTDIYGKSALGTTIIVSSHLLAGTVGFMRYQSGQHFPTDIIAGALVGSGIGLLVPYLHKLANKNISACILPGYATITIRL